jgi:D-aminoacyl-tRNA deacylase
MGALGVTVINSAQDEAGRNIRRHLEELLCSRPPGPHSGAGMPVSFAFHEVEGRLIHADGIDRDHPADLILFISRHTSREPSPVLTVHVTGNLSGADLGGKPRSLAPACPPLMQAVLRELRPRAPPGYAVSCEVTHHGPTELATPSFFVEIGSTATEWADPRAGRAVAEAILAAVPGDAVNVVGFGGNHYAARQTEIGCSSRGAFGHIAHSREVPGLDREMITLMRDRSRAVAAYIDRKALIPGTFPGSRGSSGSWASPSSPRGSSSPWGRWSGPRTSRSAPSPGQRLRAPAATPMPSPSSGSRSSWS